MARIFVGLSGGVDSAVSAAVLKEQGHDVVGTYIKIWSPEFLECTWRQDRLDAKRVAVSLGIPFLEVDLSKPYRDSVISDMLANYQAGITPNPDVLCNRFIKFGSFAEWAFQNGADMIATGHYARIKRAADGYHLHRGLDASKDQSYFLHLLNQQDLETTYFPVGDMHKSDVRKKALELDLPVARKPDSQGLCFVGDVTMKDFLSRFISLKQGALVAGDIVIGTHDGAALYTVGQRHGFALHAHAQPGPYFVTRIDAKNNRVYVSRDTHGAEATRANLHQLHWIHAAQSLPAEFLGVPRYHAEALLVNIFAEPEPHAVSTRPRIFSPGQSLVLYRDDECIGGAVIR